jgi:hypothetical protein
MLWNPFSLRTWPLPERPGVNQGKRRGITKSPKRKKRRRR